jgi:hypothetical protein
LPSEASVPRDRHPWSCRPRAVPVACRLLLGMLAAGCSAPRADAREHPVAPRPPASPPAPTARIPEPVHFTDKGCVVGGLERAGQAFEYEGRLCGCHERRLYCREAGEPRCFAEGKWYEKGARPPAWHEGAAMDCRCGGDPTGPPRWFCIENPKCPTGRILRGVPFERGSTALSAEAHVKLADHVRNLAVLGHPRVTLDGHADASEGPAAA